MSSGLLEAIVHIVEERCTLWRFELPQLHHLDRGMVAAHDFAVGVRTTEHVTQEETERLVSLSLICLGDKNGGKLNSYPRGQSTTRSICLVPDSLASSTVTRSSSGIRTNPHAYPCSNPSPGPRALTPPPLTPAPQLALPMEPFPMARMGTILDPWRLLLLLLFFAPVLSYSPRVRPFP